jgi:2-keto-4-pentenoate hydratase
MERQGEQVSGGAGAACLGNPLHAALWLVNKMVAVGQPLKAGDLILTGRREPRRSARARDVGRMRSAAPGPCGILRWELA